MFPFSVKVPLPVPVDEVPAAAPVKVAVKVDCAYDARTDAIIPMVQSKVFIPFDPK